MSNNNNDDDDDDDDDDDNNLSPAFSIMATGGEGGPKIILLDLHCRRRRNFSVTLKGPRYSHFKF